jgi:hypothetical protein
MRKTRKLSQVNALCPGHPSCLEVYTDNLLQSISELQVQGMAVLVSMVVAKAAQIALELCLKSGTAQYHLSLRFLVLTQGPAFHLLAGTDESQRSPAENAAKALQYITNVVNFRSV